MSFARIIGQPLAVELAQQWLAKGTNHPLLFYGPDGVGKKRTALEMAKALNCLQEGAKPCDYCNACRKVNEGRHPDVRVIDLAWQALDRNEPVAKQQNLKIETVMKERHRLLQSPAEGRWKVTVLDDAHRLTVDASNVLLKILEEPPENTAIFLLTPFRDRLLPTILSRCQPVRFKRLTDEEMKAALTGVGVEPATVTRLIEMAQGSPGRALHFSREEQIQGLVDAEEVWTSLPKRRPADLLVRGEGKRSTKPVRHEIEEKLHSLLLPATRALRSGDPTGARAVQLIQAAQQQLRQNVQPGAVLDVLLLQLAKLRR